MRRYRPHVSYLMLAVFTLQTAYAPRVYADKFFGKVTRLFAEAYHGTPPTVCEDGAIEFLAENIDWLEHHIDKYGSIVAKHPNIWGEARLTKHRDEYERMMYGELNQFNFRINAAIAQSDSSFLAQAFALSQAASGGGSIPQVTTVTGDTTAVTNSEVIAKLKGVDPASTGVFSNFNVDSSGDLPIGIEPVLNLDQMSRYLQHLHELRRINEGDDTSDSPGYSLNLVRIPVSILPGKLTREGFGAEITITATPVLSDDLLPNTFRNLVINDLVDQLGLPLVKTVEHTEVLDQWRNTQSALAAIQKARDVFSKWTFGDNAQDRGEIRALINPILDNATAREAIAVTIEKWYFQHESVVVTLDEIPTVSSELSRPTSIKQAVQRLATQRSLDSAINQRPAQDFNMKNEEEDATEFAEEPETDSSFETFALYMLRYLNVGDERDIESAKDALVEAIIEMGDEQNDLGTDFDIFIGGLDESLRAMSASNMSPAVSVSGRSRRAGQPIPPSQVADIFGQDLFYSSAAFFCPTYSGRQIRWAGTPQCAGPCSQDSKEHRVDLLDIQKWLGAELASAYDMLSQPTHLSLWYQLANPNSGLAEAIRSGHINRGAQQFAEGPRFEAIDAPMSLQDQGIEPPVNGSVAEYRKYFFDFIHSKHFNIDADKSNAVLENLAWAIVVESALLNQRLNEDIRKTFTAKGCSCSSMGDEDLTFFLPEAAAKQDSELYEYFYPATQVFQEYVRCRWPIHVFAIDPREQDQNVADVSARKRELQFALAVGFVTGRIGGNSLTQYSRDIQTQIETISLNRTVAGFSHGSDTFGWRFQPRVQALDIPGTAGAIGQTVFGVSRDHDLHKRQLEPGMRECVAIVLMPSFVPYADFNVRSNWFSLTNPKNAALTMKDTVHLSKAITAMRHSRAQAARCAHCYRPGEVERLMTRVEQLDRELPLQSMRAQVPYENTLGGFEMFNTGITDLAPELVGWYGAPGVVITSCDAQYECGCYGSCAHTTGSCGGGSSETANEACEKLKSQMASLEQAVKNLGQALPARAKAEAPSICQGAGTTLFLVGDNFSVHDTKVIAGGVCIPHVQLVSRQIMRVTIPSCVNTVEIDGQPYVAVYAATPYGITNHLHVPVHCRCGKDSNCPDLCAPCTPISAEQPKDEQSADAVTSQLVPLPDVEEAYLPVSYFEEPTPSEQLSTALATMHELAATNRQALDTIQNGVGPSELVVNVQSAEVNPLRPAKSGSGTSHPLAGQMRTKVRECWTNLRDLLPCY